MTDTTTIPSVFIIESLRYVDEDRQKFEGKVLSQILKLSRPKESIDSIYYYIRTRRELEDVLGKFAKSRFRYLHISCHADDKAMATTLDVIPFAELGPILSPYLEKRRLFLSACKMASKHLAGRLIPSSTCNSVIGPATDVTFGDAALLWASFYHLMFRNNNLAMKGQEVLANLQSTAALFNVPLNYFSVTSGHPSKLSHKQVMP